jgi:dipeptidyl aminopeptidase/acylaminoacyl peptidase
MSRTTAYVVLLLASTAGAAQTTDLAAAFGARESATSASISPDGTKLAMIGAGPGQSDQLYVIDINAGATPKRILSATGKPERLYRCQWVSNDRLTCTIGGVQPYNGAFYGFSSVIAVDATGGNVRVLSKRRGENALGYDLRGGAVIDLLPKDDGKVLMMRSYVPEANIGSVIAKSAQGMGVDQIDTRTGAVRKVESPKKLASEYITDGQGNVRIMGSIIDDQTGYATGKRLYQYRLAGSNDWRNLSTVDSEAHTGFEPWYVDSAKNVAVGFETVDGRRVISAVALDDGQAHQTLVSDPRVDVDEIITIGRNRRAIGGSYEGDGRTYVYFDPAIKSLSSALSKALGGKHAYVTDANADETKLVLWAGSDTDPGQYYLFDKTAKKLSPILPVKPQLAGVKLATVRSISYPAADGTSIPALLTLPPGGAAKGLPAIVMPHGGPEARDYWGFDWLSQYFVARGFAVIQPNFRGSAGYGEAWRVKNGFRSWRTSVGDVVDAGKWMVAQGYADPAKLTVMGWSYGGYAALQANVLAPNLFKATVAVAPVADMEGLIAHSRSYTNYYLTKDFIGMGPHLREGSPSQHAGEFKAPVLMFTGTQDANVPYNQSQLMDSRLKAAGKRSELVMFDGLDHQLDDPTARTTLLQRSADFLLAAGK